MALFGSPIAPTKDKPRISREIRGFFVFRWQRVHGETFQVLRGKRWHYRQAGSAYAIHLWEGLWGDVYLRQVTPEYLRSSASNFARLVRGIVSDSELAGMLCVDAAPG